MLTSWVGYTGFVGSNIYKSFHFDKVYNLKNIFESFRTNPDLCIYSEVRSELFLANFNPKLDFSTIKNAINNIKKINPKKLALVSRIAVYDNPINIDETTLYRSSKKQVHIEKTGDT